MARRYLLKWGDDSIWSTDSMYIDAFDSMGPDSTGNRLPETRRAGAPAESREIVDVVVEYRSDHRRVVRRKMVVRRKTMD